MFSNDSWCLIVFALSLKIGNLIVILVLVFCYLLNCQMYRALWKTHIKFIASRKVFNLFYLPKTFPIACIYKPEIFRVSCNQPLVKLVTTGKELLLLNLLRCLRCCLQRQTRVLIKLSSDKVLSIFGTAVAFCEESCMNNKMVLTPHLLNRIATLLYVVDAISFVPLLGLFINLKV